MQRGKEFEVPKEVYERAKRNRGYMAYEDVEHYFNESIRFGYGLYNCMVHEENGKYICTWDMGSSCD